MSAQYARFEDRREVILESLSKGAPRLTACRAANISKTCFYNHLRDDPGFREEVEMAEGLAVDAVEHALLKKALSGNVVAMIFYLKCKRPETFTEMTRHEFRGMVSTQSQADIDKRLEQYAEVLAEIAAG